LPTNLILAFNDIFFYKICKHSLISLQIAPNLPYTNPPPNWASNGIGTNHSWPPPGPQLSNLVSIKEWQKVWLG
jgi:hypothetical protein